MTAYGQVSQNVYVKILVPNRGFEKNVSLVFQKDGSAPQRVVARYLSAADQGSEIWEAYASLGTGSYQLQVEYTDSSGQPAERTAVSLREGAGPVLYDNRYLMTIYAPQVANRGSAFFNAVVKNLAYGKRVRVTFSTDGWKTNDTIDLSYQRVFNYGRGQVVLPNDEGFEIWSGSTALAEDVDSLSYYLTYEVAGQTYVDNNFGRNYGQQLR